MKGVQSVTRMTAGSTYRDVRDGWSDGTSRMKEVAALDAPFALSMARKSGEYPRDVGPEILETYVLGHMTHVDAILDAYETKIQRSNVGTCATVIARMGAMIALGRLAGHQQNEKRLAVMWMMIGASRRRASDAIEDAYRWLLDVGDRSAGRYLRAYGKPP